MELPTSSFPSPVNLPPVQPELPKKKVWKKVVFSILFVIIILVVGFFNLPTILSLLFGKDIPLPNYSDLRLSKVVVPDEQNSFFDFDKISEQKVYLPENNSKFDLQYTDFSQPVKWDQATVDDVLSKNQAVLDLYDSAVSKYSFQIPEYADSVNFSLGMKLHPLNTWRQATRIESIAAQNYSWQNQPQKAIQTAVNIIKQENELQNSQIDLIGYLVGLSDKNLGYQTLLYVLPYGDIKSDELESYIGQLNNYAQNSAGLKNAFLIQRAIKNSEIDLIASGQLSLAGENPDTSDYKNVLDKVHNNFYFKPNQTKELGNNYTRAEVANIDAGCAQSSIFLDTSTKLVPGATIKLIFTENLVGKMTHDITDLSFGSLFLKRCQQNLLHQVVLTELAMRAYKNDNGSLPTDLPSLIPNYLPSLPLDPFSGESLKYDANKKIIYSVGQDKKDLGGSTDGAWDKMPNPTFKINF